MIWKLLSEPKSEYRVEGSKVAYFCVGITWLPRTPEKRFNLSCARSLLLVNRQICHEILPYRNNHISLSFRSLLDMKAYLANLTVHQLSLVSTYKIDVSKQQYQGIDLAYGLRRPLCALYQQVTVVEESVDRILDSRVAIAEVGDVKTVEVVRRWQEANLRPAAKEKVLGSLEVLGGDMAIIVPGGIWMITTRMKQEPRC